MARMMTISELYGLLLQHPHVLDQLTDGSTPIALSTRSALLWSATRPTPRGLDGKSPVMVRVASRVKQIMDDVATAWGITEVDAWSDAAMLWVAQRQRDMEELSSPAGETLASAVRQIWSVIDEQMSDIRGRHE